MTDDNNSAPKEAGYGTAKPRLVPALTAFGVVAVLLFAVIIGVSVEALLDITELATDTRDQVLPLVTEAQRTAINVERLERFGEIILTSSDRRERREIRLAAQILSNDAIYERDTRVAERIKQAFDMIRTIAANRDKQDASNVTIGKQSAELDAMIDTANALHQPPESPDIPFDTYHDLLEQLLLLRQYLTKAMAASALTELAALQTQSEQLIAALMTLLQTSETRSSEIFTRSNALLPELPEIFRLRNAVLALDQENAELWSTARAGLEELSESLSQNAAVIASKRFTVIADNADRVTRIVLAGLAGIVGMVIVMTILARHYVITPIIKATLGLETIQREATTVALPPVRLRELDAISRAVEQLGDVVVHLQFTQEELHGKNIRLNETNGELQAANQKITDSLRYAELIQTSLLPNAERMRKYLPNSFIIWMPRDIVGGDMIFTDYSDDGCLLIAVMDCTGHGVPGALLAMTAVTSLERIVCGEACRNPADILKRLNVLMKTVLHHDAETTLADDGLDAAIVAVQYPAGSASSPSASIPCTLTFAGARLPLLCLHRGEIHRLKGDRQSLGYRRSNVSHTFTNHTILVESGMNFYLHTDGFIDQLGGNPLVRLRSTRFGNLLKKGENLPFERQRELLLSAFQEHAGNATRQDDVTLVGFGFRTL